MTELRSSDRIEKNREDETERRETEMALPTRKSDQFREFAKKAVIKRLIILKERKKQKERKREKEK